MGCRVVRVGAGEVAAVRLAAFSSLGTSPGGINDSDADPATRHTGIRVGGTLVAVGPLTREASPRSASRPAWRIRGMTTRPEHQGNGYGGLLLGEAIEHVTAEGGRLLWGNLRLAAVAFYRRHGFTVQDDVFVTDIGVEHRYGERLIG